jgi:hypothetical protein
MSSADGKHLWRQDDTARCLSGHNSPVSGCSFFQRHFLINDRLEDAAIHHFDDFIELAPRTRVRTE